MTATTARSALPARLIAPAALLLAGLAGGCGAQDDQFPPPCPGLSLVADAGEITRFSGPGRDPTDLALHARIADVPAKCKRDGSKSVVSTLNVVANIDRGPAGRGAAPVATYFIAVVEGGRVLSEQDFPLVAAFPPNADSATVKADPVELAVPVTPDKTAAAYHIYVGFRLTPDELAYNRTHRSP